MMNSTQKTGWTASKTMMSTGTSYYRSTGLGFERCSQELQSVLRLLEATSLENELKRGLRKAFTKGFQSLHSKESKMMEEKGVLLMTATSFEKLQEAISQGKTLDAFEALDMLSSFIVDLEERALVEQIATELVEGSRLRSEQGKLTQEVERGRRTGMGVELRRSTSTKKVGIELDCFESRLECAQQRLDATRFENEKLQRSIDRLRKQIVIADRSYRDVREKLESHEGSINEMIVGVGRCNAKRNLADAQLRELMARSQEHRQTFSNENRAVSEEMERERKFLGFLNEKRREAAREAQLTREIARNTRLVTERKEDLARRIRASQKSQKSSAEVTEALNKLMLKLGVRDLNALQPLFVGLHQKLNMVGLFLDEMAQETEEQERQFTEDRKAAQMNELFCDNQNLGETSTFQSKSSEDLARKRNLIREQREKAQEMTQLVKNVLVELLETLGHPPSELTAIAEQTLTPFNAGNLFEPLETRGAELIGGLIAAVNSQIRQQRGEAEDVRDNLQTLSGSTDRLSPSDTVDKGPAASKNDLLDHLLNRENVEGPQELRFLSYAELKQQIAEDLNRAMRTGKTGQRTNLRRSLVPHQIKL